MPNTYSSTVDTPWASANGLNFGDLTNLNPFTSNIGAINIASRDLESNEIPRVANMSFTIEKRLPMNNVRSEEHTSELQSLAYLVCRLLLEKKNIEHIYRSINRFYYDYV